MVVGDDHLEPGRARGGDLVDGRDRAVDGHQERRTPRREPLDGMQAEPVAVLEPAGQIPTDIGAERAQRADHDRRRADTVDVVVAMNRDPAAGGDLALDRLQRALDPGERGRLVADVRVEKLLCRIRLGEAAADEHLREDVADPELTLERQRCLEVVGRDPQDPAARMLGLAREGAKHRRRVGFD